MGLVVAVLMVVKGRKNYSKVGGDVFVRLHQGKGRSKEDRGSPRVVLMLLSSVAVSRSCHSKSTHAHSEIQPLA